MNEIKNNKIINSRPIFYFWIALMVGLWLWTSLFLHSLLPLMFQAWLFIFLPIIVCVFLYVFLKKYRKSYVLKTIVIIQIGFLTGILFSICCMAEFCSLPETQENTFFGNVKYCNSGIVLEDVFCDGERLPYNIKLSDYNEEYEKGTPLYFKGKINKEYSPNLFEYTNKIFYQSNSRDVSYNDRYIPTLSENIREKAYWKISYVMSEQNSGTVVAMLFGDTSKMDETILSIYRISGIGHIFAVSGLHIGLLYAILAFITNFNKKKKIWKILIIFPILMLYIYICGMNIASLRALLMIIIFVLGSMLSVKIDRLSCLAFAGIVTLVVNPLSLFSAGYILSFGVLFGIFMLSNNINYIINPKRKRMMQSISVIIAAEAAVVPLTSYFFGYLSLISPIVNLVIAPIIMLLFVLIFFAFQLLFFNINLFGIIDVILSILTKLLYNLVTLTNAIISIKLSSITVFLCFLAIFILSGLLFVKKSTRRISTVIVIILIINFICL